MSNNSIYKMNHIKDFKSFSINEEAGYGNESFVVRKEAKTYSYYYKIGEGEEEIGIIFKVGKFSRSSIVSESENSYGVIHLEKIDTKDLDDILVNDKDYQNNEEQKFSMNPTLVSQAYDIGIKCLDDYLEKNPKVIKLYDEILENLDNDHQSYYDMVKNKLSNWSNNIWDLQEGNNDKVLIYTKSS